MATDRRVALVRPGCARANPNGDQLFALGADGTGLRQLTDARGLVTEADGTVIGELPYPFAYPGPATHD